MFTTGFDWRPQKKTNEKNHFFELHTKKMSIAPQDRVVACFKKLMQRLDVVRSWIHDFKETHMSSTERERANLFAKQFLDWVQARLGRPLIDALLQRYLEVIFPGHPALTFLEACLRLLEDEGASRHLSMMMCDIGIIDALRATAAVVGEGSVIRALTGAPTTNDDQKEKSSIRFWDILCADKELVMRFQRELLPIGWVGTYTECMIHVVDDFFPPKTRQWRERSFVPPCSASPNVLNVHDEVYFIGHGKLIRGGDRIAYGQRGRVVLKWDKTKFSVDIDGVIIQMAANEASLFYVSESRCF